MVNDSLYNLGHLYLIIPVEFECTYKRLCILMADYGEEILKDCKANCADKNVQVIECFNMFNSAIAAKNQGKDKLAFLIIKYINAKLNNIYGYDNTSTLCKCNNVDNPNQTPEENPEDIDYSKVLPESLQTIGYTGYDLEYMIGTNLIYTTQLLNEWNDGLRTSFANDDELVYAPKVDLSNIQIGDFLFERCGNLKYVPKLNTEHLSSIDGMFKYCSNLKKVDTLDLKNCSIINSVFYQCYELESIRFDNTNNVCFTETTFYNCRKLKRIENFIATTHDTFSSNMIEANPSSGMMPMPFNPFSTCSSLTYVDIIGLDSDSTGDYSGLLHWGTGDEESKNSLINSLLVNSIAQQSPKEIILSSNTKAVLTDEEITEIENKGFIIT